MAPTTSQFLAYSVPFFGFLIVGWYGLASVIQSKRELRGASKGIGAVEEMDPMERMRRRYNIGAGAGESAASEPEMSSLEDELKDTLSKMDLRTFEYKPVPRTAEEDTE
mmetsp:Transcript_4547/g.7756  ORF Transcript_4547/g.7756 Transcript_4547/m.7756 type:complete len:109 (+) Transcript_4547:205-531(+)|eukprot:CAMPEP_0119102928 /NCGR_PEP_ID=MMETSP1180-20130426/1514_1 /TAXON_ID=3052 ORGANISM="Chlamydomonas cf sp, Strain CCMP681" /NCGR_SAMPLE_ID=MMETSP1180 /ASSEMBLY_ACC=CAM_ASM_000741 /LENGTH=108 /DNA_ID=CAMNT_0007087313 /DNA_START=173 /DNA_END=499 /DNA_ORIENTATION=+